MATKSASNVAERNPVAKAASADVKGTHGSAVAALVIAALESVGEKVTKAEETLKDRVKSMYDFSEDDFAGFHLATKNKREEIKVEADKASLSVTQLRQAHPKLNYLYVNLSIFDMLARAVGTGWRPELDRMNWSAIKAEAKARLDSVGKQQRREEIAKQISTIQADPDMPAALKEARVVVLRAENEALVTTTATPTGGQGTTGSTKSGFQRACEMLDKLPIHELELVQAWLGKKIDAYNKARPAVSTTGGVDPLEKPAGTTTQRGRSAAKTREVKTSQGEHAAAKGTPKAAKGKGKRK